MTSHHRFLLEVVALVALGACAPEETATVKLTPPPTLPTASEETATVAATPPPTPPAASEETATVAATPPPTPPSPSCGRSSVADYMWPEELGPEETVEIPATAREAIEQLRASTRQRAAEALGQVEAGMALDFEADQLALMATLYDLLQPADGEPTDTALRWIAGDERGYAEVTLIHYGSGYVVEGESLSIPLDRCPSLPAVEQTE